MRAAPTPATRPAPAPVSFLTRKLAGFAARRALRREERRAVKLHEAGIRSGAQVFHGFIQVNIRPRA